MCFTVFLNKVDDDDDPKTFILFMTKIWDFFLSYLWPKIQHPIYNRCGWHSAPNIIYEGLLMMVFSIMMKKQYHRAHIYLYAL